MPPSFRARPLYDHRRYQRGRESMRVKKKGSGAAAVAAAPAYPFRRASDVGLAHFAGVYQTYPTMRDEASEILGRPGARSQTGGALDVLEVFTPGETAKLLKCSEKHARRLIADGLIPSTNIGRGKHREPRVSRAGLLAYLEGRTRTAGTKEQKRVGRPIAQIIKARPYKDSAGDEW